MSSKSTLNDFWPTFFLAAGASNISQALLLHYLATPSTSAATLLGRLGSKIPNPSAPTWAVVTLAGGAYAYHGNALANSRGGLHWSAICTFAALKFAVAGKMMKICRVGHPGKLTAFIGATEVIWGGFFAYWGVKASGLIDSK